MSMGWGSGGGEPEPSVPSMVTFVIPATDDSLTIAPIVMTANNATHYKITESATPPLPGDAGWSVTPLTEYLVVGEGSHTLYGWAKNASGVSISLNDTCVVTL